MFCLKHSYEFKISDETWKGGWTELTLLDEFTGPQFFFGTAILLLTLEATRRTTGAGLTGLVILFLICNWFGYPSAF